MVVATGVDTVTSISRRVLRETATDVYYLGSPFTWRLFKMNRVVRQGGLHIESRVIYKPWATGGWFYGPEVLNVEPSDTEISLSWDWKECYTSITADQRTLIRADSEYAVAKYIVEITENAKIDWKDRIADGVWSDGSDYKVMDGMYEIVDDGTFAPDYGGLARSSYPFLKAQVDSATTTLGIAPMESLWDLSSKGARAPTLTASTRANLTRFQNLLQAQVQYTQPTAVVDQTLASGGFSGGWFRNCPWIVDEHINPTGPEGTLFFLNENYFELVVNENGDFIMGDFQQPTNQFVITALGYVSCNLMNFNPQTNGKFTALTA
jgi:hypothetical protein